MIYLDNAATTPMLPCVKKKLMELIDEDFCGNPSSQHIAGENATMLVEQARENVRKMFNAQEDDVIVFTSGATEGNGIITAPDPLGYESLFLVKSAIEHYSVNATRKEEVEVSSEGVVNLLHLSDILENHWYSMVSIMLANNETGAIQPVREAAKIAHEYGEFLHTDATAAAGHIQIDFQELDVDFLTFSGHKFGAPMGTGCLIAKADVIQMLSPFIIGGNQEYGLRPGTQNVLGIVGLGAAAEYYADKWKLLDCMSHYKLLKNTFLRTLHEALPGDGDWLLNCAGVECVDSIVSIRFPGVLANTLVGLLSADGICISTGSACHSGSVEPSHVLKAMGQNDEDALSTVRVSFGLQNTIEEVKEAARKIAEKVMLLRRLC